MAKLVLTFFVYLMFLVLFIAVLFACEAAVQYVSDVPFIRKILCRRKGTC